MSEQNDLKQDIVRDKIISFIKTIQDNKTNYFQYLLGVSLVLFGFLYYNDSQINKENDSKVLTGKALNLYIDSNIDDAIVDLNNVVTDYPSTKSADIAKFYLANDYLDNDMIDDAIVLLNELSNSIDDEILRSSILNKLGDIYLDKGENSEALKFYKNASKLDVVNAFKVQYLLNVAKTYKLMNEYSSAFEVVQDIISLDDLKYNLKNEAQQLEGQLNFLLSK